MISDDGHAEHEMPIGATFLHAGYDGTGAICAWFDLDDDAERESRSFVIAGTGHPLQDCLQFLGTVPDRDDFHIWHLFEYSNTPRLARNALRSPGTSIVE